MDDLAILLSVVGAFCGVTGAVTGVSGYREGKRANQAAEARLAESKRDERRRVVLTLMSELEISRTLDPNQEVHRDSGTGAWSRAATSIRRVRRAVATADQKIPEQSTLHSELKDLLAKLQTWLTMYDTADEPIPSEAQVEEQERELRGLQLTTQYVITQLTDALDSDAV